MSLAAAVLLAVFGPADWAACAIIAVTWLAGGRLEVPSRADRVPETLRCVVAAHGTAVAGILSAAT